ncbi:hypothetical protein [Sulfurimonas sp.]|uniref:hypothetical protein n=1 Tax=Sulfurimonas sp. TaxID=2022749 RepID=UPI003D10DB33
MSENTYTTVRVKTYIKEMLEKIGNKKSIASTIADLVEENVFNLEVGISRVIADAIDFSKLSTAERIKLLACQVVYNYWEKITPENYQKSFSLIDFIDIDNLVTIDIYARIYTNTLSESTLTEDEKNNLNSLQYLRKILFTSINIDAYEKEINNIIQFLDPIEYTYPNQYKYSNLIRTVMENQSLQSYIKTDIVLTQVSELKKFMKDVVQHTEIGKCATEYEFSNINISNYKSFKNTILYSSIHNYTIEHLDSFDIYSLSCMLHSLALKSKKSMKHEAYSALLDIALITWKEYNEFFDDNNFQNYLCGNLGRIGNGLEESIQFWLDYYEHVNPPYESSTRFEFLTRTSMQILEHTVIKKRLDIMSNKKVREKVASYNEYLIKPLIASFYTNDCYWSSNNKKYQTSHYHKAVGKLRAHFWSKVDTFDSVRFSYDQCTFYFQTREFMSLIKHVLFLHQQKENQYRHIYIDCWSEVKMDKISIYVSRNDIDIKDISIIFDKVGEIFLDTDTFSDFIQLSSDVLSDHELNKTLIETYKITG